MLSLPRDRGLPRLRTIARANRAGPTCDGRGLRRGVKASMEIAPPHPDRYLGIAEASLRRSCLGGGRLMRPMRLPVGKS